ncbi:hypothetical protein [Rheinheimera sp.]|uniref:hypothetical protein n=1 Tax=Rheinheimera sp. TaxID=1869214 RepID=UPI003D28416C
MKNTVLILAIFLLGCEDNFGGSGNSQNSFPIPDGYFAEMDRCNRLVSESPSKNAFDVEIGLHEHGRPAEWNSQRTYLGDTCLIASIGPGIYKDENDETPDYYSIDVELRQIEKNKDGVASEGWLVLYQRDFRIEDLPSDFLKREITEVVSYDPTVRKAIFNMGNGIYEYKLP